MDMDKNTIIGLLLIGLIIIFISSDYYRDTFLGGSQPPETIEPARENQDLTPRQQVNDDSLLIQKPDTVESARDSNPQASGIDDEVSRKIIADYNLTVPQSDERIITIETPLYISKISSKGPGIKSWTLKKYLGPDSLPVQLVHKSLENMYLSFPVQRDTLKFENFNYTLNIPNDRVVLSEANPSRSITFKLDTGNGRTIQQVFTFFYDKYSFDIDLHIVNLEQFVDGLTYSVNLTSGLNSTESNFDDDMNYSKVYTFANDDIEDFDIDDVKDEPVKLTDWTVDWAAARTKYFTTAIIPTSNTAKGVIFSGREKKISPESTFREYDIELVMPYHRKELRDRFTVYLGPLEYYTLQSYDVNLENMMNLGWAVIRPLSRVVLFSITHLYNLIPNYGLVIILFSILVKLLLHPLTKKSYQSMKEMQKVQPLMQEIREKHKKDPQKMNAEMMKLYKEHGVNPLGGCLPMLLQMPLLFALFEVFRTTIEFRAAPFFGWIDDLSGPDTIATIPVVDLPLNVLPLVMGATMFLQQKSTITDPKQKAMVYLMPLIMTFFFYTFPSGLNLYYTLFNVFTIIHQKYIPESKKKPKPEQQKKKKFVPRKKMSRIDMMRQISKKRQKMK